MILCLIYLINFLPLFVSSLSRAKATFTILLHVIDVILLAGAGLPIIFQNSKQKNGRERDREKQSPLNRQHNNARQNKANNMARPGGGRAKETRTTRARAIKFISQI